MNEEVIYLPKEKIKESVQEFETPFFLYSEKRIRENCQSLKKAFGSRFERFNPLFAVKANPNPEVLKIIIDEGFQLDASSYAEVWIGNKLGVGGMHTGNYVTDEELQYVLLESDFILNADDGSVLDVIERIGVPEALSFRINPGIGKGDRGSNVLAGPDAKYGIPWEKAGVAYARARDMGVKRFGIHMMTGSNVLDEAYFGEITLTLFDIVAQIKKETGVEIDCMNIGGGFGVPYRPDEKSVDVEAVAKNVRFAFDTAIEKYNLKEPELMIEPGRYIGADAGWLVGKVVSIKDGYKRFIGIDASANDMPRPSIYGAYHHVTIMNDSDEMEIVSVVGSICENNDQFGKDRTLPKASIGDTVVIHNCGAHAHAMGHNYNGKPRHAEYMVESGGNIKKIRRAETVEDLFATTNI